MEKEFEKQLTKRLSVSVCLYTTVWFLIPTLIFCKGDSGDYHFSIGFLPFTFNLTLLDK